MTNMTWILDNQGHLVVTWDAPSAKTAALARHRDLLTLTQAAATPTRFSRAAALAAYYRLQASLTHRRVAA